MTVGGQPGEERDERVAIERTDLAWSRTGLALLGCLALVARRFVPLDTRADHIAAVALLAAGGGIWAIMLLLARRAGPAAGAATATRLRLVTLSTIAVAIAAFVLGLFPPG